MNKSIDGCGSTRTVYGYYCAIWDYIVLQVRTSSLGTCNGD